MTAGECSLSWPGGFHTVPTGNSYIHPWTQTSHRCIADVYTWMLLADEHTDVV